MNDVLARAARDFEDDALRRQDITKDTENEIAIAQCCRGILAGVVHHPHAFAELGPQNSLGGAKDDARADRRGAADGARVEADYPIRMIRIAITEAAYHA